MKYKEYQKYELVNEQTKDFFCFQCHKKISSEKDMTMIIQKRPITEKERSMTDWMVADDVVIGLYFHHECFYEIAGSKYCVEE